MKKNKSEANDILRLKIASRDSKHYFYGVLVLVAVIVVFRPEYAQSMLTIIMSAGGGLGFAQLIKK